MERDCDDLTIMLDEFVEACRRARLRVTHQRLEIFRELLRSHNHPSADMLYQRLRKRIPTLSLDTLYRTLSTLEEANLITRLSTPSGVGRFEPNYRPLHHHFICKRCGCIMDVATRRRERLVESLAVPENCVVESARVELRGLCGPCRQTSGGSGAMGAD